VRVTDAHAHASPYWGEPVESLLFHMDRAEVESAVLIQMMRGAENNDYLLECARRFPGRFAVVAYVEPGDDLPERLRELKDSGASGIRLPAVTAFGGHDMHVAWRAAGAARLPISCGGRLIELSSPAFRDLIDAAGEVPVVIEHMGGHPLDPDDSVELRAKVYELAEVPNTFLKVSGLGTFLRRSSPFRTIEPYASEAPPYYDMALEAFGPARLMWGSDYSPVSGRDGYERALSSASAQFAALPQRELDLIFGETARRVFRLERSS
jgi:L-fuconolactonase